VLLFFFFFFFDKVANFVCDFLIVPTEVNKIKKTTKTEN